MVDPAFDDIEPAGVQFVALAHGLTGHHVAAARRLTRSGSQLEEATSAVVSYWRGVCLAHILMRLPQ